jgi:hypothetical protein
MIVAYCVDCLPEKVVLGYNNRVVHLKQPHGTHPQTCKNGYFPISFKGWQGAYVDGDDVQTKANIVAQFGGEFL